MKQHSAKHGDPDRGPPMHEGAHHFDKGYVSDEEHFAPRGMYPGSKERGNRYMDLQNEAVRRDSKKLSRSEFSKIA
jgi:SLT domain-containing protein